MTEQERDEKAGGYRDKLRGMKDAVFAEVYARTTQGLSLLADTSPLIQLITG